MSLHFALLGHPASLDHVGQLLPRVQPGWAIAPAALAQAFEAAAPFPLGDELHVPAAGPPLRGRLIICTFLPQDAQSLHGLAVANAKTRAGLQLASDLGAKLVGLGGFTSIVAGAQAERLLGEFELAATSGNALTAALAVEQLRAVLGRLAWSLRERTVAVLGASGDIGRAITQALIAELGARDILLIGRSQARLEAWRDACRAMFPRLGDLRLHTSQDAADAAGAGLIVAATSAAAPLLDESSLRPGAIVCDIGYPNTVRYSAPARPEILVFQGGLAQAPFALPLAEFSLLPAPELLHGCFAEAIALAMGGRYESCSLGSGRLTLEGLHAIFELARAHGFRPAPLYRAGRLLSDVDLEAFSQHAAGRREA